MDSKEIKVETKVNWHIPWIAGWLFTLGFVTWPEDLPIEDFWDVVIFLLISWAGWPYWLGWFMAS